jgi:hypothetical protein
MHTPDTDVNMDASSSSVEGGGEEDCDSRRRPDDELGSEASDATL